MIDVLINNQRIDLSEDFGILINKEIADIREPEKRSSDWTKTISIPGTKTNNKIFGHIFEIEHTVLSDTQFNTNFNPNKKADAVVLADGLEQIRGFIRLLKISVTDQADIIYECSIHGQTAELFTTISEKNLYELDFSEYNHDLTINNVKNSWDTSIIVNNATQSFEYGKGYVYALIDKKNRKSGTHWIWFLEDVTPCLYAKTIVDKIFNTYGYSYTADSFFNTDRFKRLIIPAPAGLSVGSPILTNRLFKAERTTAQTIANYTTKIVFDNDSTGGNFDTGNNYNPSTGIYTVPGGGSYTFFLQLEGSLDTTDYGFDGDKQIYMTFAVYVNNHIRATATIYCEMANVFAFMGEVLVFPNIYCYTNDQVSIIVSRVYDNQRATNRLIGDFVATIDGAKFYNNTAAFTFGKDTKVDFSQFFNSEGKQSDFMMSLVKMFNLYIESDTSFPKKLRIVPRDDFYNGSTIDLSKKLDYSQPIEITPMGELDGNPYYFTYKESGDDANQSYQSYYNQTYGSRKFFVDNQFVKTEKKIEVLFQPTQLKSYGNDKNFVLSYIPGEKFGYRILYYSGTTNVTLSLLEKEFSAQAVIDGQVNKLPLTLHIDSVNAMNFDLCFGMPKEVLLGSGYSYSSNNLFNEYWYRFMFEITNKNSKIVKAYFRLNGADAYKMKFSNQYFFEGQYWKLNKIIDFNPFEDGTYQCEFLLSQYIPKFTPTIKVIGADTGSDILVYGETYPKGAKYEAPTMPYVNIGLNNSDVDPGQGIINASETTIEGINNTVLGGSGNYIPQQITGSTMIACTDYTAEESNTLYVGNYKIYPTWIGAGKVTTLTANYTAKVEDWLFLCNTSAGAITITLPDPAGISGKHWIFKKTSSNHQVTIDTADDSTIDGANTFTMTNNNETHWIVTDGTNYFLIAAK